MTLVHISLVDSCISRIIILEKCFTMIEDKTCLSNYFGISIRLTLALAENISKERAYKYYVILYLCLVDRKTVNGT